MSRPQRAHRVQRKFNDAFDATKKQIHQLQNLINYEITVSSLIARVCLDHVVSAVRGLTGDKCSIYINALVTLFVIMDTAVKISRR
jgi:hypothetical protein